LSLFLLDSLIFQAEARVRWLDACEPGLRRMSTQRPDSPPLNLNETENETREFGG